MQNKKLATIIKLSILAAMAFVIMLIEIPLPIFPSFLKIDLGDIPALIGAFAMGPVAGVIIELFKNLLHLIFRNETAGIGELANFIVGAAFVFTAGAVYRTRKTRKNAVIGLAAGVIAMGLVAAVSNYYVFLPLYEKALGWPISAFVGEASKVNSSIKDVNSFIVYAILPFNILKGLVVALVSFFVYKKVSPVLHK